MKLCRITKFNPKMVETSLKKKKKNEENIKKISINGLIHLNQANEKIKKIIIIRVNLNQIVINNTKKEVLNNIHNHLNLDLNLDLDPNQNLKIKIKKN